MTHKDALKQIIDRIYEYEITPLFPENELAQWKHLLTVEPEAKAPVKRCKTNTIPKAIDWLKAAQHVNGKTATLPILNSFLVRNGKAICANTDQWLTFSTDLPDGFYVKAGNKLLKTEEFNGPEDFPTVSETWKEYDLRSGYSAEAFPAAELYKALIVCQAAQSTDETRHILNGVLLTRKEAGGAVKAVSTDGRRLHTCLVDTRPETDTPLQGVREPFGWVIPTPAVKVLLSVLKDRNEEIRFSVTEKHSGTDAKTKEKFYEPFALTISLPDGGELVTKIIEGTYPNFEQAIPAESKAIIPVQPENWLAALKELEPVCKMLKKSGERNDGEVVRLVFSKSGPVTFEVTSAVKGYELSQAPTAPCALPENWELEANGEQLKNEDGTLKVDVYGKPVYFRGPSDVFTIAVNIEFLADILKAFSGVTGGKLELNDELSPLKFSAKDSVFVMMPIRIS